MRSKDKERLLLDYSLEKDLKNLLTERYKTYLQGIQAGHFGGISAEEHKIIQRTMIKGQVPFVNALATTIDGEPFTVTEQSEVQKITAESLHDKFQHDGKWQYVSKYEVDPPCIVITQELQ